MKKLFYGTAIVMAAMTAGCSNDGPDQVQPIDIELTRSEENAVKAVNEFSFDLMRTMEDLYSGEIPNYIVSPQGAAWCISMMANGAEPGSETEREILDVLRLGSDATIQDVNDYSSKLIKEVTSRKMASNLNVANAIFYKDYINIKPDFVNTLKTFYGIGSFENSTNDELDNWISDQTEGMIKDFAKKLNLANFDFGVLNTMLFNGKWCNPFDVERTKPLEFRNADGTTSLPMTMQGGITGCQSSDEICNYLRILFSGGSFTINFVIPTEGHTLDEVRNYLTSGILEGFTNLPNSHSGSISVQIPRLDLENDFNFVDVLKRMGIRKAFTGDSELTKIGDDPMTLARFDQSSKMKLDEEGVKVATVTDLSDVVTSAKPGLFFLDEPFYFFITEESTGAILFLGKVSQL